VVLNFHGYTSNAWQQESYSGMSDKADEAGFIAVHPDGIQNSWNAGGCCGGAAQQGIDDVGFVGDLLDALAADFCVDPARIYATGMSNGGFMAQRLACDLSDRIAAIASVAGYNVTDRCEPTRPVPVMHFHGTADATVDYGGVDATIRGWVQRNDCTGGPVTTYSNGDASCETYSGCADDASVVLCTIDGGGHSWPGAFGANSGIDATDALWDFLSAHRMK
jgi:polyhydroxybutyrate depolymerase